MLTIGIILIIEIAVASFYIIGGLSSLQLHLIEIDLHITDLFLDKLKKDMLNG